MTPLHVIDHVTFEDDMTYIVNGPFRYFTSTFKTTPFHEFLLFISTV